MNQKRNQGYQNTHRQIKECLQQLIEKKDMAQITVSEICKITQINRSTFYAHYEDIYDVLAQMQENLQTELLEMYEKTDFTEKSVFIVQEYLLVLLRHISMHRTFYRVMMSDMNQPMIKHQFQMLKDEIITPLFHQLSVTDNEGSYYFNFAVSGFVATIGQWLDSGCPETPEQLAAIIFKMMPIQTDLIQPELFQFHDTRNSMV